MKMDDASGGVVSAGDRDDLSLMLGGPLYQLYRRTHLTGDALELLRRRVLAIALFAWVPLLLLSLIEGHAWTDVKVPFLLDVETHVRLLIALPLLIAAEIVIHERMPVVVRQFVDRGIIDDKTRARFEAAVASALRLRNSIVAEVVLLIFVYSIGIGVIWRHDVALPFATWYRQPLGASTQVTLAGWWYVLVSLPIFQFLLFRWYFRLLVWARFLWQVSRMELNLAPLHPDQAGGLGFLGGLPRAFAPLLLAHGVLLAGLFADGIFFAGMTLVQYKVELLAVLAWVLFVIVGPLLVFVPILARTKRAGMREYGLFAQRYVREFDHKWLRGKQPTGESPVGSSDIQSLADLGNSFAIIKGMQVIPVSRGTVLYLAIVTVLPVAPLLLTMISMDELLTRLTKLVF